MSNYDSFKIKNPAYEAVQKMQNSAAVTAAMKIQESTAFAATMKMETSGAFAAVRELQKTLEAARAPLNGATAMLEEYHKTLAPIRESLNLMHTTYAPIFEATKMFNSLNMKGLVAGLKTSKPAMTAISKMDLVGFASIVDSLPKYDFLSTISTDNFTVEEAEKLFDEGEITQQDVNEELVDIITKKKFSPLAEWDKLQKSKWFIAIQLLFWIVNFVFSPVIDYTKDKALDTFGITEFWNETGIYEYIDEFFENFNKETVTEEEAKETVDTTKTGNITKQKREDLLAKIKEIRTFISSAPQDENTGNLLSYLSELEKDVNGKKYGLVFEEHREEIDEVLDSHTPVLTEDADLFIENGGEMNFLIEGDNLASLKLLEKTHKGKIDVIFIDPPYNTRNNDFGYDDSRVDFNDGFRHSKWLSFMRERLSIARKLLKEDGVIFIAIDDNEQAALKLLCDKVFGEDNFLASVIWQHSIQPKGYAGTFSVHHNYLLCYQKTPLYVLNSLPRTEEDNKAYSNPDNDPRGRWRSGDVRNALYRPNLIYDIISPSGKVIKPCENGWRWSKETVEEKIRTGEIIFSEDETRIIRKIYLDTLSGRTPETIWFGKDVGTTRSAMSEIKEIFGSSAFGTPKPTGLIERVLHLSQNKNALCLDFFAGSGTTGHAVMKLNAEDGGKRKFILCTNNENNICREVTYERVKRVIDKENYAASLKYYKVEYIPVSERMYYEYADELLHHIRELVELENGVNFTNNAEIAIVLTEEELEEFVANIKDFSKCKKLYMGHDLLPSEEQEEAISSHEIEVNIIPDYYYRDLQEA